MKRLLLATVAAVGAMAALPAAAQFQKPEDAIKAAMGAVGGSCKACHDDFRAEKCSN
ncbi:MAG: cytochrome c [Burkholderiaceae bacterium]|jgi:cytochrome c556|nr:cytochrome c [Burkholderiaceae bacterium]